MASRLPGKPGEPFPLSLEFLPSLMVYPLDLRFQHWLTTDRFTWSVWKMFQLVGLKSPWREQFCRWVGQSCLQSWSGNDDKPVVDETILRRFPSAEYSYMDLHTCPGSTPTPCSTPSMSSTFFHFAHEFLPSFRYLMLDLYGIVAIIPITDLKRRLSGSELTLRSTEKTDADWGVGVRVLSEMLLVFALATRPLVTLSTYSTLTYRREPSMPLAAEWVCRGGLGKRLECRLFEAEVTLDRKVDFSKRTCKVWALLPWHSGHCWEEYFRLRSLPRDWARRSHRRTSDCRARHRWPGCSRLRSLHRDRARGSHRPASELSACPK